MFDPYHALDRPKIYTLDLKTYVYIYIYTYAILLYST